MKKLIKTMFAILILSGMISFSSSSTVKAQLTYDLNGNQIDVITYAGGYEKGTGYRFISSEESGTIAYFDGNGNLIRLINRTTKEVIISNEETTATPTTQAPTIQTPEKVTLKRVTGLKKKIKYSYYKGVKAATRNGNIWGKIKYKYGITLTWNKVKGATGYEIYRYENAAKRWTKIKTTKKAKCTLTNMLKGENVKIKIRSYKNKKSGKEYGKYSKVLEFTTKQMYTKIYYNLRMKTFYSKFGAEDAFVYQNKLRKKEGAQPLKWSDILYAVCVERIKKYDGTGHDKLRSTITEVLVNQFGVDENDAKEFSNSVGENLAWAECNVKSSVELWYKEKYTTIRNTVNAGKDGKGHYRNMIKKDYVYGAYAMSSQRTMAVGLYCDPIGGYSYNYDGTVSNIDYSFILREK